ncbi:outer dense fiber protein 3-like [Myotis myotis]|uniref:outer dense fiber protein 3-like n=1 Tax=Myotis myotis TaxID=51298 RepID=UPI00174B2FB0|nr:outer dense fiber protein 3-like [Myotis myotis]
MPPLHSAHRPPTSVTPLPRPVWGPQGPAPTRLGVIPEAPARARLCRRVLASQHPLCPCPPAGDYFPEKSTKYVFDSAPSHSISARTKTFRVDSTPGPAAYMLPMVMGPHTVGKASQPSYSIKGRSKLGGFSEDLHKTPGPAAYHQTDVQVTKFKAPQYTIAARVEPPGDKTLKPGPGAHSPEKVTLTKPCAPIVTFGIKHSDYMTPLILQVD